MGKPYTIFIKHLTTFRNKLQAWNVRFRLKNESELASYDSVEIEIVDRRTGEGLEAMENKKRVLKSHNVFTRKFMVIITRKLF